MSIKERRQREKEQLKKAILEEAFGIINEEGYQALTIRRLADRIDYSPRTIYLYFSDKEELLRAVAEYGFEATVKNLEINNYYEELSPEEKLRAAIANHLRTAAGNINYYNAVIHIIQGADFEPGPCQRELERYFLESLGPYLGEDGSAESTLFYLFASLRGIAVELINRNPPKNGTDLERIIEQVFKFYKRLLKG